MNRLVLCRNVAGISGEVEGKRIDANTFNIVLSVMKRFLLEE